MSGISRLSNQIFNALGLDQWGNRQIIPNDMDEEIVETNQNFQCGTIDSSKIKNLKVDTITVSPTGYIRSGKLSAADSTNAGWFFGPDGIYVGSASDASYIKYVISSGAFEVKGALTTNAGSVINGTYVDSLSVAKLTAGSITSKAITLAVTAGAGDSYIAGGNALDLPNWRGGDANGGAIILGIDDSDSDKGKFFAGNYSTGQYAQFDGTNLIVNDSVMSNQDVFGDGSDGNVTISADTTLTSDMYYDNLTINSSKVLNTGGYRIFVRNTLTNNGTIARNGNNGGNGGNGATNVAGSAGTAGAALATGTIYGSIAGVAGGAGSGGLSGGGGGTTGNSVSYSLGANGVAGGSGGNGGGGSGGSAGPGGTATATVQPPKNLTFILILREFGATSLNIMTSSAGSGGGGGGGGGSSDGAGGGGGGSGSGGGIVCVFAKKITGSGYINSIGGNGGNGGSGRVTSGTHGGGGGGGGGNGGVIFLVYSILSGQTISVAGGTGGTGGNNIFNSAVVSQAASGADGAAGKIVYIQK